MQGSVACADPEHFVRGGHKLTATQQSQDSRKTNKAKQPALSPPSRLLQSYNGYKVTHTKTENNYRIAQWE